MVGAAALAQEASSSVDWHTILVGLAVLGELLAFVFVFRVLVRGGSPASTLLWVVLILVAPWFGLLLYYLLPRRLQLRRIRRLRVRGARLREVRPRSTGPVDGSGVREQRSGLSALLGGADATGTTRGNTLRWLATGEQFLAAASSAIGGAQRHVHCVVYIFRPDAAGMRFLEILTEAAQRGVAVRLCFDSLGSLGLKRAHLEPLRRAGGRAEAFLPLLWKRRPFTINLRNHRKLLVVDGEVAYVGGRNVGDEYFTDRLGHQRPWRDAMLEVRGPAVERLQDVFVEDWCTATDEVLADTFRLPPPPRAGVELAVVCSGPDRDESDLWFAVVQAINDAQTRVELSSPYLVPPPTLLFALQLAAARGVAVRLQTNGPKVEATVLYHAQRSHYRELLTSGIELYESVGDYNHAKVFVVDGRHVWVGSANMDLRSKHLNFEVAVMALDAVELAQEVEATLAERRARARRITMDDLPTRPLARALDGVCGLLSPLL